MKAPGCAWFVAELSWGTALGGGGGGGGNEKPAIAQAAGGRWSLVTGEGEGCRIAAREVCERKKMEAVPSKKPPGHAKAEGGDVFRAADLFLHQSLSRPNQAWSFLRAYV